MICVYTHVKNLLQEEDSSGQRRSRTEVGGRRMQGASSPEDRYCLSRGRWGADGSCEGGGAVGVGAVGVEGIYSHQ